MKKLRDIVPKRNLMFLSIKKGATQLVTEKYVPEKSLKVHLVPHHSERIRQEDTRPMNRMIAHYKNAPLESHHITTIEHYTGQGHRDINKALWHQHKHKHTEQHITNLDEVMKMKQTPSDMKVYSGIQHHPMEAYPKKEDSGALHVHLPAFTSASLSHNVARGFAGKKLKKDEEGTLHSHILKIHVPKGSNGFYASHLSEYAMDEKEFVIPRNSQMKIHPTPHTIIRKYPLYGKEQTHHFHIWHARLVHDGEKEV